MSRFELTGLARIALLILHAAEESGLDREELMLAADLRVEELRDPDARISLAKIWSVWHAAIQKSNDPAIGVRVGMASTVRQFGIVGYTMRHSSTLRQALQKLVRYGRIISDIAQVELDETSAHARVWVLGAPSLDALGHPVAARLASVLTISEEMTATRIAPVEVMFPFAAPDKLETYRKCFRARLRFDQPRAGLVLRPSDLDRAVSTADETLRGYLEQLAEGILSSLATESSVADQVRRTLWVALSGGQPTLEEIAAAMGLSVRTLQRRLRREGTSFADLLDEFRRQMATHLLKDRTLAVYEIAYLLGYSDPSTFFRAFRRWYGTSPQSVRCRSIA